MSTDYHGEVEVPRRHSIEKSWLLAIQFPDREQPSVYPIGGGDTEKLMAKLTAARDCWPKVSGALPVITVCYEVGYDAFWLARFLKARGIECLVIDPGSVQVNRARYICARPCDSKHIPQVRAKTRS
jgi:hypothetical protein